MEKEKIQQLEQLLGANPQIVITSHTHPDGDAVGSAMGLHLYLQARGYNSKVVLPDKYPSFLDWLDPGNDICIYQEKKEEAETHIKNAGLIFCVDYNQLKRANSLEKPIEKSTAFKVMIDHHPDPEEKPFDLVFSHPEASSTSEIIFHIVKQSGRVSDICKQAASALYVGIMTDTGSFKHSSTRRFTFEVAAELVDKGIDIQEIGNRVYDTYSEWRLRLLGFSLSERLVVLPEFSTAYIYLSKKDMEKFRHQDGDTEGLVNYGLSIKGINLAALITEREREVRLSLRSKKPFSVNQFARDHFDGGGHDRAAGGSSDLSLEGTIKYFESLLPQYKKDLNDL